MIDPDCAKEQKTGTIIRRVLFTYIKISLICVLAMESLSREIIYLELFGLFTLNITPLVQLCKIKSVYRMIIHAI